VLAVFPLRASVGYDFLFLHQAEDGESYLYAYDFDSDAQQLLEEPIQEYDLIGHWVLYMSESQMIRLDVESGESIVFYECEPESHCGNPHFSANEDTILFRMLDTSDPLADIPALYQLILGAEPEKLESLVEQTIWLTEYHVLTVYDPMGEAALLNLYDVRTGSSQPVELGCLFCGGVSISLRSDGQQYFVTASGVLVLKSIDDEIIASYPFPQENYDFYLLYDWNPVNETVLYTASPLNEDDMATGGNHIFLFDLADESTQALWEQDDFDVFGLKWNPSGNQFLFIADPIPLLGASTPDEFQIWLYDMEAEEALPLPVLGYSVQWIE
jgi:hypothetical protein